MKILKGIITGIGVLAVLLCALILLSAANPKITNTIASFVSGDGFPSEEESGEEQTEFSVSFEEDTQDEQEPADSRYADSAFDMDMPPETEEGTEAGQEEAADLENDSETGVPNQPEEPAGDTSASGSDGERVTGTNGYEAPETSGVKVPEAVSNKSGYQPVTEKSEQLPDTGEEEYVSDLGYGETGDGLSFDATLYPYYQMLDEKGQHLYRQVYANAAALNEAFAPIEEVTVPELKDVIMAVYNDHPELFWLNTIFTCKYDQNKICAELALEFNLKQEELSDASSEFYNITNTILTQLQGLSVYEKERRLHDILIERVEYDKGADKNQSAYSALVEGKSVCAGYARAYQYLMQRLGIACYYCTGYAGTDHAWNIVALDDGYYNVDVTWDDTEGGEYDYFNKTDEDYADTHVRQDLSVNLPKCEGQMYRSV